MSYPFERLEGRILLSAEVSLRGNTLVIVGDDADDNIELVGTGNAGEIEVRIDQNGDGDFNDDGERQTIAGVENIKIVTRGGADDVSIDGVEIVGKLFIKTDGGNDEVFLGLAAANSIGGKTTVNLGRGDDVLVIGDTEIGGKIKINGGKGNDVFADAGGNDFAITPKLRSIESTTLPNLDPTAVDNEYSTDEDSTTTGNVLSDDTGDGTDSDPEADTLTVVAVNGVAAGVGTTVTLPSGALLTLNADGSFTYDPNGAFEDLRAGDSATDPFTYTISDGNGNTDTATVTITVNGVNDDPTAVDDAFETDEASTVSGDLLAANPTTPDSDPDSGDVLTITEINGVAVTDGETVMLPSGALLTINADGTFTYDPNGAFEFVGEGESDSDSFTYTISDGNGGASTATATVTINGINDEPIARNDTFAVKVGNTLMNRNVLHNNGNGADSDADGDSLTITKINDAAFALNTPIVLSHGTLQFQVNGVNTVFDYTPNVGTAGQVETFTYTISDGNGGKATATVTINITA